MDILYYETSKLLLEVQQGFERFDKVFGPESDNLEKEIQARLDKATSNCERMESLVFREPVSRRQAVKFKVDQVKYDLQHHQASLRMLQHKKVQKIQEEQEREELLTRRFTTLASAEDTSINIDLSLQHHTALQGANRGMDDLLNSGSSILESMRDQRTVLKGARRKILDIAGTLGLSNTTIRYIEKRAAEDKVLLIAGMVITLLIILLTVKFIL
ncbi:probable Golgi SNAP receptor complex member 2 [Cloeon dipterum]|uniref:probable Golgi SNAP receptor complex member 2 n=1 Tax=Cloeon dipterum TaxID=197152 RepID=UPI0032203B32